jgi:ribosomal protein S1
MTVNKISFLNYIKTKNSLLKVSNLRDYRLKSQILKVDQNKALIDLGHYKEFKATTKELNKCFNHNRRIFDFKKDRFAKNKINFFFKEINPQENLIFKNSFSNIKSKNFSKKVDAYQNLRKAFFEKKLVNGRIVKKVKSGFIVAILGFFAFLPKSHIQFRFKKLKRNKNKKKLKLINTESFVNSSLRLLPLRILAIKSIKLKKNVKVRNLIKYSFNILVSLRKAINTLRRYVINFNTEKLIRLKKIKKLKIMGTSILKIKTQAKAGV